MYLVKYGENSFNSAQDDLIRPWKMEMSHLK